MSRPSAPSRSTRRLPLALILGTAALTTLTAASAAGGLFGQRAQVFAYDAWDRAEDGFADLRDTGRDTIIRFAADLDIPVKEKRITRDEVYIADEAFFTGTAAEVTPIREVDGRTIGAGQRGPITQRLQAMYFDQVHGRREDYPDWLTLV